jgi:hypothetical protein
MDILFLIAHDANFNTAIQALMLIYQVASSKKVHTHLRLAYKDRVG